MDVECAWCTPTILELESDIASDARRHYGSIFGELAPLLLTNGFSPIPIEPSSKRPLAAINDWSHLRKTPLTGKDIAAIAARHADAGLGVVGGFSGLTPIDVDDQTIIAAIESVLPKPRVTKWGRRGATHFYRSVAPIPARKFRRANGAMVVEFLTNGLTVIPPSIHPETNRSYQWLDNDQTLFNCPIEELPEITASHSTALETVLTPWTRPQRNYVPQLQAGRSESFPLTRMRAYALAALADEEMELRTAIKGGRNNQIFAAVCRLGRYVHNRILNNTELQEALRNACLSNGLIAEHGLRAFESTFESGLLKSESDQLPILEARPIRGARVIGRTAQVVMFVRIVHRTMARKCELGRNCRRLPCGASLASWLAYRLKTPKLTLSPSRLAL